MTKKTVSRFASLLLMLAMIFTTCGWIPFAAPVTIETAPPGAEVFEAGTDTLLGTTPYKTLVFFRTKQLEVRMDNYYTKKVALGYQAPETVRLTLAPTPVLVYTVPAADVVDANGSVIASGGISEIDVLEEEKTYTVSAKGHYDEQVTIGLGTETPQIIELKHRPLITLSAVQSGVEVFENGSSIGKAPVTEEVENSRTFEFRKDGFFKKSVTLTAAQTHKMNYAARVKLEPLPVITIKAEPSSAKILMTGKSAPVGIGSAEVMIEKETAFEVKAGRYYAKSVTADLRTQTLNVSLDAMPYVNIKSSPSGASVKVNGKPVGTTPVEQLVESPVRVEVTKDGYTPQTVSVSGNKTTEMITLKEVPPPPPKTVISTTPAGAAVSVDGKAMGASPVELVIEKEASVTVSLDDYHSKTVTLDGSDLQPTIPLEEKSFWQKLFGK